MRATIIGILSLLILLTLLAIFSCSLPNAAPVTVDVPFSFTEVGDDGIVGKANVHDMRIARTRDSLLNHWNVCYKVLDVPLPAEPNTLVRFVSRLTIETGVPYYSAIKTADEVPNWSAISNIHQFQVADTIAPSPIADFGGAR